MKLKTKQDVEVGEQVRTLILERLIAEDAYATREALSEVAIMFAL
jgi:hypothetical protein